MCSNMKVYVCVKIDWLEQVKRRYVQDEDSEELEDIVIKIDGPWRCSHSCFKCGVCESCRNLWRRVVVVIDYYFCSDC
ncbi:hypothetical protein HanPI659440_Chr14g0528331 [Helianthus annuus]|nr:hypothetical protein HanPI659440_Chr14g0528331 [Helianthus annuus]